MGDLVTADDGARQRILSAWLDVEALGLPTVPDKAAAYPKSGPDWTFGEGKASPNVVENTLYLGLFDGVRAIVELRERLGFEDDPADDEKPWKLRKQLSCHLATVRVSPDGRLVEASFQVPSFVLRFEDLPDRFDLASHLRRQKELAEGFEAEFPSGDQSPVLGSARIRGMASWLAGTLRRAPPGSDTGRVRILQRKRPRTQAPEPMIGGSFLFADLTRVAGAMTAGASSAPLLEYLSRNPTSLADRRDADDPGILAGCLAPGMFPAGKWPGRGRGGHPLVLRQQVAVNEAVSGGRPLVAVNGPPGTGKTTLLRDVVAAVITERARVLASFDKPEEAFVTSVEVQLEKKSAIGWKLDPRLEGFGILVASSNNTAVQNVTNELPKSASLAGTHLGDPTTMGRLRFYPTVSDEMARRSGILDATWGTVSAALGNTKNRKDFLEAWWPDEGAALQQTRVIKALGAPSRTADNRPFSLEAAVDGLPTTVKFWDYKTDVEARIRFSLASGSTFEAHCAPDKFSKVGGLMIEAVARKSGLKGLLMSSGEGWPEARAAFQAALSKVERLRSATVASLVGPALVASRAAALDEHPELPGHDAIGMLERAAADAREALERASGDRDYHVGRKADHAARRPGAFARMMGGEEAWRAAADTFEREAERAQEVYLSRLGGRELAEDELRQARDAANTWNRRRERLAVELREAREALADAGSAFAVPPGVLGDPAQVGIEAFEKSSPVTTEEFDLAREEVFICAVALHKAFLRHAAKRAACNFDLFARMASGRDRDAIAEAVGRDVWNTLFLSVPVVSSTFASVGSMFGDAMGREDIGWLLLDESGQAVPQAAAGALWRARRAVVVGDPKQVEPVCEAPVALTRLLVEHHGVPAAFDPNQGSVQSLADRRASLGGMLGRGPDAVWVGCPLRVHRRSSEPMFSISNRISYVGSMVMGKQPFSRAGWSGTIPEWGPGGRASSWLSIGSADNGTDKWVEAQGGVALNILLRMVSQHTEAAALTDASGEPLLEKFLGEEGMPNVFVVSPFRQVVERMQDMVVRHAARFVAAGPAVLTEEAVRAWAKGTQDRKSDRIGTVHAFQGKEMPTVLLLLGGTEATAGAVGWAGGSANILNVAATRAQDAFHVIGSHGLWSSSAAFRSATEDGGPVLQVVELPDFVGTVADPERIVRIDTLQGHLDMLREAFKTADEVVRVSSPYLTWNAVGHCNELPILPLVRDAVARNIRVVIYNDPAMSGQNKQREVAEVRSALLAAGAELPPVEDIHAKTLCIDDTTIVEGSFNWLSAVRQEGYAHRNHESSFCYRGVEAAAFVARAVERMEATGRRARGA